MSTFKDIKSIIQNTYFCLKRNQMDFVGQKLAFLIKNIIFTISTILAIVIGYYYQNLALSAYIILAGTLMATILVLPTWPMYNRNNIEWSKDEDSLKEKKRK
ncbi:microsomal signal peptidase protein, putative [Plasmodium gallinaceum]|uniref:Signal peptidase complex subunit 1 n=1 Tax=Plasmodium gallinaceum TaxID=5849 RepID=A0A1J1GTR3_PLAGA|nr:microsomal signal peptidase protein, putative [Plasmodium gallinaceum]CRG95839.1 microsomal signal peptidase protein, putative [Plasmodium gallinaceum]